MEYTKTTLFIIEDEAKEVEGYTFGCTLTDGTEITLGVYKRGAKWVVVDPTCGAEVCTGLSRKKVVARATNKAHLKALTTIRGTEDYEKLKNQYESIKAFMDTAAIAEAITLETMREWCEGKGLKAKQKREGSPIWVFGQSKPYKDELKAMGFAWGTSKSYGKGWYYRKA